MSTKPWEEAVRAVLALHEPFRIYEPCGHDHNDPDDTTDALDIDDVGLVCIDGYQYPVCTECCTRNSYQTEECATYHSHSKGHRAHCTTAKVLAEALGVGTDIDEGEQ